MNSGDPLPRGILKPLARLLWLPVIWLGVGWASLPYFFPKIDPDLGSFGEGSALASYGIAIACVVSGLLLLMHGMAGDMPDELEMERRANQKTACPFCGGSMNKNQASCDICKRNLPF